MNSLRVIFDYDTWQEIFSSIKKNKVRTIITVIGVLWGIFIYITLSGSSNGLDNGLKLLVNSSRSIIYSSSGEDYAEKAMLAAAKLQEEMEKYIIDKGLVL